MQTKLDELKALYEQKEYRKALAIAAKFPRLGKEKHEIILGYECAVHPSFYEQIGYDCSKTFRQGVIAMALKYHLEEPQL